MSNADILLSTIKLVEDSEMFVRDDQVFLLMGLYRLMNYELTRQKFNGGVDNDKLER